MKPIILQNLFESIGDFFANMDWRVFVFVLSLVLFGALLIIIVISLLVAKKKNAKWRSRMVDKTASTRVYKFDQYKNNISYFNLSNISKVRNMTFDEFYKSLPPYESPKVRDWIESHLEWREGVANFLPTEIYVHSEKRILKSFLKVTNHDKKTNLLHVESHIIAYDTTLNSSKKHLSTIDEFNFAIEKNGHETGMTFCFALHSKKEGIKPESDKEACTRFINEIARCANGNQLVIECGETAVIIANFDMRESSQAMSYALKVNYQAAKEANKKRKGVQPYEVRCGVVANKDLNGNVDLIITEVRKASENALINKSSVYFYNKNASTMTAAEESSFKTEVERIVANKRLVASYRPIVKCEDASIIGYMANCSPMNTTFGHIEELQNYALRADDSSTLFGAMVRLIIPKFRRESKHINDGNLVLYYPMRTQENDLVKPFFSSMRSTKKTNICFLYTDKNIGEYCKHNGVDSFIEFVDQLSDMNLSFSILFDKRSVNIDKRIIKKASYLFVDFGSGGDVVLDTKSRSELYALTSKLLVYAKPIIAINLNSWNAIELVVGSGIENISADPLAPYNIMFKPLSERRIDRIKNIKKN